MQLSGQCECNQLVSSYGTEWSDARYFSIASMAGLKPVIIVDESHNVTSSLSQDMLRNLNPSFVFELTATPRTGANIISFVDALVMRDQHMVKLPVIVRNLPSRTSVIAHEIDLSVAVN
ncbi:DEAD/DEAH box helicase family protein [Pseudomonas syringae]|uniref:DEAD/DEAH box helicase family protein n=1 Tax=Pseudomonas syringae TaxID=317 RepID=UPI001F3ED8A0|nr:DEAD/DEAH box helicase family protein [Pseudomonas syringae]